MILTIRHTSRANAAKTQAKLASPAVPVAVESVDPAAASADSMPAAPRTLGFGASSGPISFAGIKRGFKWLQLGRAKKRLQMLETVSLGEKRFVALVQVDGRQFLIGGAPSNVGMLAELAPEETFQQVLRDATQGLEVPIMATPAAESQPSIQPEPLAQPAAAFAETPAEPEENLSVASTDADDHSFDLPFSFSPSVLARMQTQPVEAPSAPQAVELPQASQPAADVAAAPLVSSKSAVASMVTPNFTFQLSPTFPLGSTLSSEQTHSRFGTDGARRMASVWKLREATS